MVRRMLKLNQDMSPGERNEQLIEQLERVCAELHEALVQNRTLDIEKLVVQQCDLIRQVSSEHLTENQRQRLVPIHGEVEIQQRLIRQALGLTNFFYSKLLQSNSYSALV